VRRLYSVRTSRVSNPRDLALAPPQALHPRPRLPKLSTLTLAPPPKPSTSPSPFKPCTLTCSRESTPLLTPPLARVPRPPAPTPLTRLARKCLWRVDSLTPPHILTGLLRRAYGKGAEDDSETLPLGELIERLYKGAVRRHSPRAEPEVCDVIEEAVRGAKAATKGKKGKGAPKAKKGKMAEVKPEGVDATIVLAAIMRADPMRSAAEAEWLTQASMAAARAEGGELDNGEVGLEAFCTRLGSCLVQRSDRHGED